MLVIFLICFGEPLGIIMFLKLWSLTLKNWHTSRQKRLMKCLLEEYIWVPPSSISSHHHNLKVRAEDLKLIYGTINTLIPECNIELCYRSPSWDSIWVEGYNFGTPIQDYLGFKNFQRSSSWHWSFSFQEVLQIFLHSFHSLLFLNTNP